MFAPVHRLLVLAFAVVLTGCVDGTQPQPTGLGGPSGPGVIRSLTVDPDSLDLPSPGSVGHLSVRGVDAYGQLIPFPAVTWTSLNATIVSVDTAGLVTALASGTARVRASSRNVEAFATVLVRP